MTALQKVNLGSAPAGSDGDAVRTAFVKDNANVDVLNAQACLTSVALITAAQALTTAHIGKRVNINLSTAGTINLPAASTCAVDQVTLLRNLGSTIVTLAITIGSGDTVSVSKLNPGETALMDTDGVHTWSCLMRGRTNSDNETVNGNCTVNGNETISGALTTGGYITASASSPNMVLNDTPGTGQCGVTWQSSGSTTWQIFGRSVGAGGLMGVARFTGGAYQDVPFSVDASTGAISTTVRPTFAGKAPWDSGNLPGTSSGGVFNFSSRPTFAGKTPWDSGNLTPVTTKAFFSGSSASLSSATIQGCGWTYLSAGRVRITFTGGATYSVATDMLIIGGVAVSNGTNWCVPAVLAYASDGTYVDIGAVVTGNGGGTAPEMVLSLTVLKVR